MLFVSCVLRTVAFACRAAYLLGPFRSSLVGVFLAFSNAGFGACVADMCLVTAVWCGTMSVMRISVTVRFGIS